MFYAVSSVLMIGSALLLASPFYFLTPVLIAGAFAVGWLYHQPALGLFAIIFLVPLEILRQAFPDYQFLTFSKLIGVLLVAVVAVRLVLRAEFARELRSPLWVPILLLLGVYGVSAQASSDRMISLDNVRQLLTAVSIFALGLLLAGRYGYRALIYVIVISVSIPSAVVFLSAAPVTYEARATGLLADPNFFCMLIIVAMPLVVYLLKTAGRPMTRLWWAGLLFLQLAAFTRTYSRAGMLVLVVLLLLAMRDQITRLRPRHFGVVLLVICIAVPAVVALVPAHYVQRIQSLGALTAGQSAGDASLGRRASYVVAGWEMVKQDPLLGSGPGTFPEYYARTAFAPAFAYAPEVDQYFRDAHNTFLQLVAETGVPGLAAFCLLIFLGLRNFYRARQIFRRQQDLDRYELSTHLGLALLGLSLFLLFLSNVDHKYLWLLLAVSHLLIREANAGEAAIPRTDMARLAG